jgi:hypothetical protein
VLELYIKNPDQLGRILKKELRRRFIIVKG